MTYDISKISKLNLKSIIQHSAYPPSSTVFTHPHITAPSLTPAPTPSLTSAPTPKPTPIPPNIYTYAPSAYDINTPTLRGAMPRATDIKVTSSINPTENDIKTESLPSILFLTCILLSLAKILTKRDK